MSWIRSVPPGILFYFPIICPCLLNAPPSVPPSLMSVISPRRAEAKYLSGVGVAKQRKAIVDGLRSSIVDFSEGVDGTTSKDIMDLLLLTQYFDCIRDVGVEGHCKTTFVPSSRSTGDDVRNALLQAGAAK